MARYDYECQACQRVFEVWRSMTDETEQACPECGKPAKRLISSGMGLKMPVESSLRYQKYFHSDTVQKKLKSGEYDLQVFRREAPITCQ